MATPQAIQPRRSALSIGGLIEGAGLVLCVATFTGFFGELWWVLDLTSHFRVQLAVALGALAVSLLVKRRWWIGAGCSVCAAVNLFLVLSLLKPVGDPPSSSGARLRLAALNVHAANDHRDLVLDFLRAANADVILLMEVNGGWMHSLSVLAATHTNIIAEPREDDFGIALFSRIPLTNGAVVELGAAGVPSITANAFLSGQELFLLGTHPLPPGTADYARMRNEQLRAIATTVRARHEPVVVFGDLNVTPWSPFFRKLVRESGLKNTSQGRGLFASWPAWFPPARIPLDHCLISESIRVADKRLGPRVGSDHLPVLVELQLPQRSARPDRGEQD